MAIVIEGAGEKLILDALNKSKEMRNKFGSMSWQSDQANDVLAMTLEAVISTTNKLKGDK